MTYQKLVHWSMHFDNAANGFFSKSKYLVLGLVCDSKTTSFVCSYPLRLSLPSMLFNKNKFYLGCLFSVLMSSKVAKARNWSLCIGQSETWDDFKGKPLSAKL